MPKVYYGKKNEPGFDLEPSNDLIAVRTRSGRSMRRSAGPVSTPLFDELEDGVLVAAYPEAGVEVFRVPVSRGARSLENRKTALRADPDVKFAGGVLVNPATQEPVLYTENLFVKFVDAADAEDCEAVLRDAGLTIKKKMTYAIHAYFVEAVAGSGQAVFEMANDLLRRGDVEYCHPELITPRARKAVFPQQWHLKKTQVNGVTVDAHSGRSG